MIQKINKKFIAREGNKLYKQWLKLFGIKKMKSKNKDL
jgi:hypothetical protein